MKCTIARNSNSRTGYLASVDVRRREPKAKGRYLPVAQSLWRATAPMAPADCDALGTRMTGLLGSGRARVVCSCTAFFSSANARDCAVFRSKGTFSWRRNVRGPARNENLGTNR
uniref:Uncharacterized protein n=1 Tax=Chromera velia CCMP2878 TaxID=1169474 RepID=A0A0G4I9D4_9ALVE|eukprot:Cvel_12121.t1-p1 / transcript=Cvel_12121.t1 / gene=Cvel_12121 / organism=Chromera_velia_CCMP2878 / gene_product=Retrovirus-related Pol polyprotein from transposon, putative / transcript_product=Retrovirus-related Pol polyprotein from transposon, putative / location=Cvel_scaffold781:10769-11107(+) / protein_length=113 / sequence_SO=supercontig / SO=protein_coding / is_pseudo=false